MDPGCGHPASEFLERAPYPELVQAVRNFGEEPRWRRVIDAIVGARGDGRLQRTLSFAQLVEEALGGRRPGERTHPATRTFQGIRMAVNGELAELEQVLPEAFARLVPGGRMAVISFHSLEDRMVKRFFRRMAGKAEHGGDHVPEQLRARSGRLLSTRPLVAASDEVARNPRARSAKLRVIEKLKEAA
jgi:16S rRNA (cytosine1402-N4)-methyltransferase